MLRIAVPNKGSLAEPAADMLAGKPAIKVRRDLKELVVIRPRATRSSCSTCGRATSPIYVGSGTVDTGHHRS
jgi:ATP phosphoribosyltransferase